MDGGATGEEKLLKSSGFLKALTKLPAQRVTMTVAKFFASRPQLLLRVQAWIYASSDRGLFLCYMIQPSSPLAFTL